MYIYYYNLLHIVQKINTFLVIFNANYPQGNIDREKGQSVKEGIYGRKYGKTTINEILWQPITMYIYLYIYVCSK